MAIDILTLAAARKYAKDTANALGAIKGAPCEIQSIEDVDGASVVTFRWTGTDGSIKTQTMTVPHGMTEQEQAEIIQAVDQNAQIVGSLQEQVESMASKDEVQQVEADLRGYIDEQIEQAAMSGMDDGRL